MIHPIGFLVFALGFIGLALCTNVPSYKPKILEDIAILGSILIIIIGILMIGNGRVIASP